MNAFYSTLVFLQVIAALILIFEAINKSHQCTLLRAHIPFGKRISLIFKALAWMIVALASAGVVISPVLRTIQSPDFAPMWVNPQPSVSECGVYIAFAILVVRSWVFEVLREMEAARVTKEAQAGIAG